MDMAGFGAVAFSRVRSLRRDLPLIAFGGFAGIAFSRSRCPHVLRDLLRVQGTDATPPCRICCGLWDFVAGFVPCWRIYPNFVLQDLLLLHFPGLFPLSGTCCYSKFQGLFVLRDLSEFHISALVAFAFSSIICIFRDLSIS